MSNFLLMQTGGHFHANLNISFIICTQLMSFGFGIKLSVFHKVQMSTNYKTIILYYYLLCPLLFRGTGTSLSIVKEITLTIKSNRECENGL
jgi:hypothetical protein